VTNRSVSQSIQTWSGVSSGLGSEKVASMWYRAQCRRSAQPLGVTSKVQTVGSALPTLKKRVIDRVMIVVGVIDHFERDDRLGIAGSLTINDAERVELLPGQMQVRVAAAGDCVAKVRLEGAVKIERIVTVWIEIDVPKRTPSWDFRFPALQSRPGREQRPSKIEVLEFIMRALPGTVINAVAMFAPWIGP